MSRDAAVLSPSTSVSKGKRVCMITHSFYESDNRVIRYAETLAQRGDAVEVLALRRNPETPREEIIRRPGVPDTKPFQQGHPIQVGGLLVAVVAVSGGVIMVDYAPALARAL